MHAPVPLPPVTRTTCPYCGVGCGVSARPDGAGGAITTGDPDHPANFGRLCSKGFALEETLGRNGRLLRSRVDRKDTEKRRVDQLTDRVVVGHIDNLEGCPKLLGDLFATLTIDIDRDDAGAFFTKPLHKCRPNAMGAAGDDGDFVL